LPNLDSQQTSSRPFPSLPTQYSLVHFFRLYRSGHNIFRLFFFHIQAIVRSPSSYSSALPRKRSSLRFPPPSRRQYNAYQLFFSWFALANVWLTFSIIIDLVPALSPHPIYLFVTKDIVRAFFFPFFLSDAPAYLLSFLFADNLGQPQSEMGLSRYPHAAGKYVPSLKSALENRSD